MDALSRIRARSPRSALGLLAACRRAPPDGVALVGATLIDGSGGPPLPNAVVVVRGGRIESVGTADGFTLPATHDPQVDVERPLDHPGPDRRATCI